MRPMLAALLGLAVLVAPVAAAAQSFTGAGSTLLHPLLQSWSRGYIRAQADPEFQPVAAGLDYEAVGSQAGLMRVRERAVDFAASELPLSGEEIRLYGVAQYPVAVAGVAVAVNLPGLGSAPLRLTGEVMAGIYLGRVRDWSDPAIKALNPDVALPSAPIVPVRRADGSGTTFTVNAYLARQNPDWRGTVGTGLTMTGVVGVEAKGNDGVAEAVRRTPNAIGYVDLATARRAGLAPAALRNAAGAFVTPGLASLQAAAAGADWARAEHFDVSLVDAPGEAAYPIVTPAYVVLPRPGGPRQRAALAFFDWALENGAAGAAELGYVPLPVSLINRVRADWTTAFSLRRS